MATRVTDVGLLQYIPKLPRLRCLSLAYLDISDRSLSAVGGLPRLERINLTHTAVTNDAIANLVNRMTHTLRRLNLSNTVVNDRALAKCLPQSQLSSLSLIDTGITDAACRVLAGCAWLNSLRLDLTVVTDDGVRHITNCTRLKYLELFRTEISDLSLVWLSDTNVEHLGLGYTSVTDAGVPALTDFRELITLDLQGTSITDRGLRFLSPASLSRLRLEDTKISNDGLEFLLKLPLATLSLNPEINDSGLAMIARHQCLRQLAIWDCRVTNWRPLKRLEQLEMLLIDDCVEDLSPLHSLRKLEVLVLWGNKFAPTEVNKLRLSLPKCQILTLASHVRAIDEFWNLGNGGNA